MEREFLNKTLTQKGLERLLNVSPMTIYLWRKLEIDPLPCRTYPTEGGKHRNVFLLFEVRAWVVRNRPKLIAKLIGGQDVQQATQHGNAGFAADLVA